MLRFPGAPFPLAAMLCEQKGFDGIYISGAVIANELGLPDTGLTTSTEVSQRGSQIARVTRLPAIIDIDTGFGHIEQTRRAITLMEEAGLAGCHLEDQIQSKRCGHISGKALIPKEEMVQKIKAAAAARHDKNFFLIARTDARAPDGLNAAIERAKAYQDAGADMIFPEALQDSGEFARFRNEISLPLMANMTEFGKSPLLSAQTLADIGYNVVIYPVTLFRLAMQAMDEGLDHILQHGTQQEILTKMQHRSRLYEILKYDPNKPEDDL